MTKAWSEVIKNLPKVKFPIFSAKVVSGNGLVDLKSSLAFLHFFHFTSGQTDLSPSFNIKKTLFW